MIKKTCLLVSLLIFLQLRPCHPGSDAITPVEAMHLVEAVLNQDSPRMRLVTVDIQPSTFRDHPAYIINGRMGQDGYSAIIDAKVARVMSISKNGDPYYLWQGIQVVGHRGTVKFAPENTIPAFEAAIEYGADLVEIDIRETRDGELVIIHDDKVDRTTNGSGRVADMTLAEIKQLDAGSWFGKEFEGVKVPTLKEALGAIRGRALPDVDFKAGTPGKLIAILKEEGLLGRITLYCGDWDLMTRTIRQTDGFFIRPTVPNGIWGLPIVIADLDPPIININWKEFSEKLVREAHLAGKKSFLNAMQQDTRLVMLKMIETAPDYLQSDHLDILMPILRAKGLHK